MSRCWTKIYGGSWFERTVLNQPSRDGVGRDDPSDVNVQFSSSLVDVGHLPQDTVSERNGVEPVPPGRAIELPHTTEGSTRREDGHVLQPTLRWWTGSLFSEPSPPPTTNLPWPPLFSELLSGSNTDLINPSSSWPFRFYRRSFWPSRYRGLIQWTVTEWCTRVGNQNKKSRGLPFARSPDCRQTQRALAKRQDLAYVSHSILIFVFD